MNKYFPSAKSKPLGIILWGILLAGLGLSFYAIFKNYSLTALIITSVISLIVFLFVGIVWFGTGYFVSKDYLIIKIGPITHSRIRISSISKISRSNSIISSPANSLKRLAIQSGKRVLALISPKDESDFITTISELNSGIDIEL